MGPNPPNLMAKKPAKPTGPVAKVSVGNPPPEGWEGLVIMPNGDAWPAVYRDGTFYRLPIPLTDRPTILNPSHYQLYL